MKFSSQSLKRVFSLIIIICFALGFLNGIAHAKNEKIKFAVISDNKEDYTGLQKALTFIAEQQVDFIITAGDFSPLSEAYHYYTSAGFVVSSEKEADEQDIYFVIGNHDHEPYGELFFQENIAPYYPENGLFGAPRGTIYSFDKGNAHFIITNQYWNYKNGGYTDEQLNWIENDLRALKQRYKFVVGHEPAYPMDRHIGDSLDADPAMRDAFWEILSENNVQAFFCGHTHHLSVIKDKGVYQIDSGEVAKDHISVVIVEFDENRAVARLYETKGSIPVAADHNSYNTSLTGEDAGDEAYEVVFSSDIEKEDGLMGCFIQTLAY